MNNYFDYFAEVQEKQLRLDKYNRLKYSKLDLKKDLKKEWVESINPDIASCRYFSGILTQEDFNLLLNTYLPGSFAIQGEFQLEAPYYSADDDHYYIIDNPVMKDKVFKAPMMRGSSWKGVLATAARRVIESDFSIESLLSFGRLFGSGSEEFRKIEEQAKNKEYQAGFDKEILFYALQKFGKITMKKINNADFKSKLWKNIKERELQTQRGRLIFYPTFFNRLGLEMINPHKRRTKAGTQPVYYEVVPRGATGNFQLLYVPADGFAEKNPNRTEEINNDIALLDNALKCIFCESKDYAQVKIGAKTKLGWGKTKIEKEHLTFIKREEDELELPDNSILKLLGGKDD